MKSGAVGPTDLDDRDDASVIEFSLILLSRDFL
jgi:hypothetical protein